MIKNRTPREGELFLEITIDGHRFELRYGHYEESDRIKGDPVPIYPDLKKQPVYTKDGKPLVTAIQTPCAYYDVVPGHEDEEYCCNCIYYSNIKDEISICECKKRRLPEGKEALIESRKGGTENEGT